MVADEDSESDFSRSVYRLAEVGRALKQLNEHRSQQEDAYQVANEKRYGGFGGFGGYGRQPHHNLIRARNPDPAKKELYELLRQKEALSQSNSAIRNRGMYL